MSERLPLQTETPTLEEQLAQVPLLGEREYVYERPNGYQRRVTLQDGLSDRDMPYILRDLYERRT